MLMLSRLITCIFLQEYEYQSSPEAKLVKELDQFEMILQAYEYEDLEKKPGRLQEFFDSTKGLRTNSSFCYIHSIYNVPIMGQYRML